MCGRYRLTRADRLAERFDAEIAEELHPRYNIAPTQPVPVVRASGPRRVIGSMRWGLIPNWAKDTSMRKSMPAAKHCLRSPPSKRVSSGGAASFRQTASTSGSAAAFQNSLSILG